MTREEAQVALVVRMRAVRAGLPRWWAPERQQAAIEADPECQRLLAQANELWGAA